VCIKIHALGTYSCWWTWLLTQLLSRGGGSPCWAGCQVVGFPPPPRQHAALSCISSAGTKSAAWSSSAGVAQYERRSNTRLAADGQHLVKISEKGVVHCLARHPYGEARPVLSLNGQSDHLFCIIRQKLNNLYMQ